MAKRVTLWLLFSAVATYFALLWLPASLTPEGVYVPVGTDSFYHAARITDALDGNFYQFDDRIHAPEGSWVTWPWGYDWFAAKITGSLMALSGIEDPMAILAWFPVAGLVINLGLLVFICTWIGLDTSKTFLALACYALLPLTQQLHAIGAIDHHYVEHMFVLASLWAALHWFEALDDPRRAALPGLVLGIAPAFHNGLFLLQLPVIAALLLVWLRRGRLSARATGVFALSLLISTVLVLLPSGPFRDGQFYFYTLSWFHLLAASATAGIALVPGRREPDGTAGTLIGIAVAATVAITAAQIGAAGQFLGAQLYGLDAIQETRSVLTELLSGRDRAWTELYSGLLWLLPLVMVFSVYRLWRSRDALEICLFAFLLPGALLLATQFRLHYFGSLALFLPLLWAAQFIEDEERVGKLPLNLTLGIVIAIAFVQPVNLMLRTEVRPGGEFFYTYGRPLYPVMRTLCAERPGLMLADDVSGHYIRYHTDCSVISNAFNMTPLHQQKIREARHLMSLAPAEFLEQASSIDYVFVMRQDNFWQEGTPESVRAANAGLRYALLFEADPPPAGFRLVKKLGLNETDGAFDPIASVYAIER